MGHAIADFSAFFVCREQKLAIIKSQIYKHTIKQQLKVK